MGKVKVAGWAIGFLLLVGSPTNRAIAVEREGTIAQDARKVEAYGLRPTIGHRQFSS